MYPSSWNANHDEQQTNNNNKKPMQNYKQILCWSNVITVGFFLCVIITLSLLPLNNLFESKKNSAKATTTTSSNSKILTAWKENKKLFLVCCVAISIFYPFRQRSVCVIHGIIVSPIWLTGLLLFTYDASADETATIKPTVEQRTITIKWKWTEKCPVCYCEHNLNKQQKK